MRVCACSTGFGRRSSRSLAGLDDLKGEQGHPFGRLRLYVTHLAGAAVIAPVWARFLSTFPDVQLEVHVDSGAGRHRRERVRCRDRSKRVGRRGHDRRSGDGADEGGRGRRAGILRPAAPAAHARRSCPPQLRSISPGGGRVPCSSGHSSGKASHRQISVDGRVIVNDTDLAARAAVDGLGIAYTIESLADPFLRSGQLVRVLADWSPSFDGLFLYYPGHRQVPVALRALIDMLRSARGSVPTEGLLENPFAAE